MTAFSRTYSHDGIFGQTCGAWGSMLMLTSLNFVLLINSSCVAHSIPSPARLARYSYLNSNPSPLSPSLLVLPRMKVVETTPVTAWRPSLHPISLNNYSFSVLQNHNTLITRNFPNFEGISCKSNSYMMTWGIHFSYMTLHPSNISLFPTSVCKSQIINLTINCRIVCLHPYKRYIRMSYSGIFGPFTKPYRPANKTEQNS